MKSNRVFLSHIPAEANFLIERTRTLSLAEFAADDVITRACTRSVEVIGEAVKNLSPVFRTAHAHVEWQRIAGTAHGRMRLRGRGLTLGASEPSRVAGSNG